MESLSAQQQLQEMQQALGHKEVRQKPSFKGVKLDGEEEHSVHFQEPQIDPLEYQKAHMQHVYEQHYPPLKESEIRKLEKSAEKILTQDEENAYLEHCANCRKLNQYRQTYQKNPKFPHEFRKFYDPDKLSVANVKAELATVRALINGRGVPSLIRNLIDFAGFSAESMAFWVHSPWFNLNGLHHDVQTNLNAGEFDPEIEQLGVEFADYLGHSPGVRLAAKLAMITGTVMYKNMPGVTRLFSQNLSEENKRQYQNLRKDFDDLNRVPKTK